MIPIDGCFEDVLQLWPLFFDVNCRLPPVIDAASRMSCSSGRCSSSSTAACQVIGVIDLLFFRNGRIPEEEEEDGFKV